MRSSFGSLPAAMVLALAHALIAAQQPAGHAPEFDAVSVKLSDPRSANGTVVSFRPGAGLRVVNATLKDLIETGYDVRQFQILGGPSWAGTTRYDVAGTPDPRSPRPDNNDVRLKVQAMLKDRFHLQVHRQTRNGSIYSLVVANGGIKPGLLRETDGPAKGINAGQGTMLGDAASMTQLAYKLSRLLERPVVNSTGLDGNYDFKLEWAPESVPPMPDGQTIENPLGPSLFTALQQQLGLRLVAANGPVDFVVIDRVDRPSEN